MMGSRALSSTGPGALSRLDFVRAVARHVHADEQKVSGARQRRGSLFMMEWSLSHFKVLACRVYGIFFHEGRFGNSVHLPHHSWGLRAGQGRAVEVEAAWIGLSTSFEHPRDFLSRTSIVVESSREGGLGARGALGNLWKPSESWGHVGSLDNGSCEPALLLLSGESGLLLRNLN